MKRQLLLLFPVLLLIAAAISLTVLAIDAQPLVLLQPRDASVCVETFLNSVADGDLEQACSCFYGSVDLHESSSSDKAVAALRAAARAGFSYNLNGELTAAGMAVEVPVIISYTPIADLQAALEQGNIQAADEDALCLAVESLVGSVSARTVPVTVRLIRESGRWQIIPEQTLLDLMTGQVIA